MLRRLVTPRSRIRWSTYLSDYGRDNDVRYYQFSFVDLFGTQRSKLVPAMRADEMAEGGAGFAGFATHLKQFPEDGDLLAKPDLQSLRVLPWNPEVGWLSCDLYFRDDELSHGPRNVLRRSLRALRDEFGFVLKTGVECEFFLLDAKKRELADFHDTQAKPCYDAHALMRQYDLITSIADAMDGTYQCDHEDANGQFEINWDFADALTTADRVVFFKYLTRSIAEGHGLRASFMPKPFANLTGNGCHMHISLHDANDDNEKNVMSGTGVHGLSDVALRFLSGILREAPALAAIANPTINSYKRLHASTTTSGATWSPDTVTFGGNDRTVMCRIPDSRRIELRIADMAANPYLFPAAVAAAGLAGLRQDPDLTQTGHKLPRSLRDALDRLDASSVLRSGLGDDIVDAYIYLKRRHCDDFDAHLSQWELDNYLDV